MNEVVEVSRYPKASRKKRTKPFKRLTEHRKLVQARKALKKAYKRKYGTKTALRRADVAFSAQIRRRDGKCMFPGCKVVDFDKLQNSHYIGRAVSSTRFDPDNCITLCWLHHFKDKMLGYEYQKQTVEKHGWDGQYTIFMRKWLGEERFNALIERSKQTLKRTDAIKSVLDGENCLTPP